MRSANRPCREILASISAYLDGDLETTVCDAVERHCQNCPGCATLVQGLRETVGLCRQAAAVSLPDSVRQQARDRVRQLLDHNDASE